MIQLFMIFHYTEQQRFNSEPPLATLKKKSQSRYFST